MTTPAEPRSSAAADDGAAPAGRVRSEFALLFVCLVSVGMGQSILFSVLPPAAREIGISPFQVSTIFATSATIWVFVSPAWGRRSDIAGRRAIIIVGLIGYALSMGLLATVIEVGRRHLLPALAVYPAMIASRCVFALLGSGTGPAAQAYIADRTTREERTAGVALVSAAMGLGETIGPGVGALLAATGLVVPIYLSAGLAIVSAAVIARWLPESAPHPHAAARSTRRMRVFDRRILPFLLVSTSLQAARGTTVVTLAFFLQDALGLDAAGTVRASGFGFVVLGASGLIGQLVIVRRLRLTARALMRSGAAAMVAAFALLVWGESLAWFLVALGLLGLGLGLVRPGASAAASLSVGPDEQGAAAGILGGVAVMGNIFGPMIGTAVYELSPTAPYVLNAAMMGAVLVFVLTSSRVRAVRV